MSTFNRASNLNKHRKRLDKCFELLKIGKFQRILQLCILFWISSVSADNHVKPYIEAGIGVASSGIDLKKIYGNAPTFKEDNKPLYYSVAAGWLIVQSPKFAIGPEFAYSKGPITGFTVNNGNAQLHINNEQFELLGTARFNLNKEYSIIAKLGAVFMSIGDVEFINGKEKEKGDITGVAPKIYIAGQYNINQHVGLSLFFSNVFGAEATTGKEFDKSFSSKDIYQDEIDILKIPAVMALGASLTFYF
jgi:hypothetical protein